MTIALLPPLGAEVELDGNITTNSAVGPRSARTLGESLGFGKWRLAQGWAIAVLIDPIDAEQFQLHGITLRSGGRLGAPAATPKEDEARTKVHDAILVEHGSDGYDRLKSVALGSIKPKGPDRVVKVLTALRHVPDASPRSQYPMGGGGAQWYLAAPHKFRIVMVVDGNEIARIPGFSAFIGDSAPYDDRARLARYLDSV
jgi:hypothetical protein